MDGEIIPIGCESESEEPPPRQEQRVIKAYGLEQSQIAARIEGLVRGATGLVVDLCPAFPALNKFLNFFRLGVMCNFVAYFVFYSRKNTKLTLNSDIMLMRVIHHFFGKGYIVLKGMG